MKIELKEGMEVLSPEVEKNLVGGADDTGPNVFFVLGQAFGYLIKGLIVFGKEGGRNAGLCVK